MKTAVIDVGSNSVRLGLFFDGLSVKKQLITSRLGEGVTGGTLCEKSVRRTVAAIEELKKRALDFGADEIYAFATEAVRRAANGKDFLYEVLNKTGVEVYLVPGEVEAELAAEGAVSGENGLVIDLGGASTEIAAKAGGRLIYSRSVPVGAVVLNDVCGRDKTKLAAYIAQKTALFENVPHCGETYAVGGTATSVAAAALGLKEYAPELVHGTKVTVEKLRELADKFEGKTPLEICAEYAVDERRAEIIFGSILLLEAAVLKTGNSYYIASESDNLEGFYNMVKNGKINAVPLKRG